MTKTGKPDVYWYDILCKYAQGKYHFTTGKKPGAKKWKAALHSIDNCPSHKQTRIYDMFGKRIACKCGYHKNKVDQYEAGGDSLIHLGAQFTNDRITEEPSEENSHPHGEEQQEEEKSY
ncbi:hypothetical protein AMELA_G00085840 [Ameiurus melas]|uniref:Uncharacterized protein n=1 Tax=Ameiurus melas TaxID=219545 RepID=A0A7J6AVJ0_AMEME|nr:hypothetical protein AMELA_G00085840 [Ameiurus melas]